MEPYLARLHIEHSPDDYQLKLFFQSDTTRILQIAAQALQLERSEIELTWGLTYEFPSREALHACAVSPKRKPPSVVRFILYCNEAWQVPLHDAFAGRVGTDYCQQCRYLGEEVEFTLFTHGAHKSGVWRHVYDPKF